MTDLRLSSLPEGREPPAPPSNLEVLVSPAENAKSAIRGKYIYLFYRQQDLKNVLFYFCFSVLPGSLFSQRLPFPLLHQVDPRKETEVHLIQLTRSKSSLASCIPWRTTTQYVRYNKKGTHHFALHSNASGPYAPQGSETSLKSRLSCRTHLPLQTEHNNQFGAN